MNMRIKKTPLRAVRLEYECNKCGGKMEVFKAMDGSNTVTGNNPIKYLHICKKCGRKEYLPGKFPRIEHME
jgi:predicted nucleic acid-binding Zn ribbon protein